jgi:hypothetical protein
MILQDIILIGKKILVSILVFILPVALVTAAILLLIWAIN